MKKILMTLFTLIAFIGSANTDSLTDTDKAAQKALAEQYVQALKDKDMNTVNQLIDYDVFFERLNNHLSVKSKLSGHNKSTFIDRKKGSQKMLSDEITYITLIGWRELPDFSGYIIRLIDENYLPSYLGLIAKKTNKQWKIVDFYDGTEKTMSSHSDAKMLQQVQFNSNSIMEQLKKNNDMTNTRKLAVLNKQIRSKQFSTAANNYRSLPDELKKQEVIVDLGVIIASYYPDEKFYDEILTVIGQYYQNNPKYYAEVSDYFLTIKKDYNKAREITQNIFILDKAMLNLALADISFVEEDYPRVFKEIKQCVKAEPSFKLCYDLWVSVAHKTQHYDEEVAAYKTLSKKTGSQYTKSMFNEQDNGDFVHSDAFKNWDIPEK